MLIWVAKVKFIRKQSTQTCYLIIYLIYFYVNRANIYFCRRNSSRISFSLSIFVYLLPPENSPIPLLYFTPNVDVFSFAGVEKVIIPVIRTTQIFRNN